MVFMDQMTFVMNYKFFFVLLYSFSSVHQTRAKMSLMYNGSGTNCIALSLSIVATFPFH